MFLGPICHNSATPFVLGMPFILGWIVIWTIITAAAMGLVYWLDPARLRMDEEEAR